MRINKSSGQLARAEARKQKKVGNKTQNLRNVATNPPSDNSIARIDVGAWSIAEVNGQLVVHNVETGQRVDLTREQDQ